jgi:hypothetical protein
MNQYTILNMPAGYELNKLIAENVLGMRLEKNYGLAGGYYWVGNGFHFGDLLDRYLPDYSGELAPAFSVVEKLCNENGCDLVKVCKRDPELLRGEWSCNFGIGHEAFGETVPLAICRAALLVVRII